jgi:type IV pilus assembly protein PilZ
MPAKSIKCIIKSAAELNLSYMPFIVDGGLFVPTTDPFSLGDIIQVDLQLPEESKSIQIEGKVVWLTPPNALYHVLPGIGVQLIGSEASNVRSRIEAKLDSTMEVGGYTYGIADTGQGK